MPRYSTQNDASNASDKAAASGSSSNAPPQSPSGMQNWILFLWFYLVFVLFKFYIRKEMKIMKIKSLVGSTTTAGATSSGQSVSVGGNGEAASGSTSATSLAADLTANAASNSTSQTAASLG